MTKRLLLLAILFLGIQAVTKSCSAAVTDTVEMGDTIGGAMIRSLAQEAEDMLYGQFMPCITFAAENGRQIYWLWQEQIDGLLPFYSYLMRDTPKKEDEADFHTILMAEAEEGIGLLEEEPMPENLGMVENTQPVPNLQEENMEELLRAENEAALRMQQLSTFVPHTRQSQVDLEPLMDSQTLIQQFYTVDPSTSTGSEMDVGKFMAEDMSISKDGEGPQILIYHTHSQEGFSDSVPGDASTSIMGVGDRLTEILTNTYGYEVLHYRGQYDVEGRDDAYSRSLPDIERVLEEYPSIEVVIDLHRDAVPESTRLVMDLDGRPTARFMFFNGLSRTRNTGNIAYLYNENLESNLAFSFQMQMKAVEYYPGLTRRIYLKAYRYNMHLCPKYLLIEMGAQNNTVEEVMNACDPLAHILDMVLSPVSESQ